MEHRRIYVNAASAKGIGGYSVTTYFLMPNRCLSLYPRQCEGWSAFPNIVIAWLELYAACVAIDMFAARYPGKYLIMYSVNTNVVLWLTAGPPTPFGCTCLAIERRKYQFFHKLSVQCIPSEL